MGKRDTTARPEQNSGAMTPSHDGRDKSPTEVMSHPVALLSTVIEWRMYLLVLAAVSYHDQGASTDQKAQKCPNQYYESDFLRRSSILELTRISNLLLKSSAPCLQFQKSQDFPKPWVRAVWGWWHPPLLLCFPPQIYFPPWSFHCWQLLWGFQWLICWWCVSSMQRWCQSPMLICKEELFLFWHLHIPSQVPDCFISSWTLVVLWWWLEIQ